MSAEPTDSDHAGEVYRPPERDGRDHFYLPGEKHFGASGPAMAENGWAVYPQERDERRRPARIDGTPILWSKYHDVAPTAAEIHRWSIYAATQNTAIILGPPSGNVICLDCDIVDEALSFAVRDVAEATLGLSPYRRVGTHPKVALFYRMPADELPRYQKYVFTQNDGGGPAEDMIEVLAKGRSITAEGIHHKTGNYFTWLHQNPILTGPELAPLISTEQLRSFFVAVEKLRPFHKRERDFDPNLDLEPIEVGKFKVELPRTPFATFDPVSGLIVDGRKTWLFELVKDAVKYNPRLAMNGGAGGILVDAIFKKAVRELDLNNSIWDQHGDPERALKRDIAKQIPDRVRALREGKLRGATIATYESASDVTGDDTLTYFAPKAELKKVTLTEPDEGKAAKRKLIVDRTAAREHVSQQIGKVIQAWIGDIKTKAGVDLPDFQKITDLDEAIRLAEETEANGNRVHLVNAITGSGKTTKTLQAIASDAVLIELLQRVADDNGQEIPKVGPIVFLMPSHANIDETIKFARLTHLQPDADDDALIAGAVATGMSETEAREQVGKIRRFAVGRSLNIQKLEGKQVGGCFKPELVGMLEAAGSSSSMLCKSKIVVQTPEGPKNEERFCDRYAECPVIAKRRLLANADIVFAPRAYLTLPIPPELKHVAGVVADERIFGEVIGAYEVPFKVLEAGRGAPPLTKKDREAGIDEMQLLTDRQAGARIVMDVLRYDRGDPADALYAHKDHYVAGTTKHGADYATAGKKICGAAWTRGHSIDPSLPLEQLTQSVEQLVKQPAGVKLREEYGMWATFIDRINAHAEAELNSTAAKVPKKDPRIQYKQRGGQEYVRVSYAKQMNWPDCPWLLLDASADEVITESIFPDRKIDVWDIVADVNMRALACLEAEWSTGNLIPGPNASPTQRLEAAQHLANARSFISLVAGLHANGRVLVSSMMKFRRAIENGWTPPENVDFVHFGATAGYDFARQHVAQIVIGRSEKPSDAIDGYVGALARNDDYPEEPIDPYGDGLDLFGEKLPPAPTFERTLALRNGADATYPVLEHKGPKANAVQRQAREEEVRQAIGRLRAMQREDTTTCYLITRAVPVDVVIDRLVSMTDLKNQARPWEAVRRAGGIIEAELLAHLAPDIRTVDGYEKFVRELPKSVLERYHRVTVAERVYLVPGHESAPLEYLKTILSQLRLLNHRDPIVLQQACAVVVKPADVRPADKIETYLSAHADQRNKFIAEFMQTQWAHVRSLGIDLRSGKIEYTPTAGVPAELAGIKKPMDVWLAFATIADPWIRGEEVQEHPANVSPAAAA